MFRFSKLNVYSAPTRVGSAPTSMLKLPFASLR